MNRIEFLLLLMLSPLWMMAQDDIEVSIDTLDIEEITIAATRQSDRTPVSFQNIVKPEIEDIYVGQDPVWLMQRLTPSVVSYSDGGTDIGNYSQFRLRGMDQDRVNITLNGVPLNDMVDHGVYFSNFSDFGNSIQSMQVTRGVGATSNGVASYAGAVNYESISPFGESSSGSAQLTLGSFGTLRTALEANTGKLNSGWGGYGRMTRTQTDGYKYNSGSDSYSLFGSVGRVGEDDMFKITAFSGKTQNGQSYEHVSAAQIAVDPRTNGNALNDVDDFEQHMVQAQYSRRSSETLSYGVTAYYGAAGGVFPYTWDGTQTMYGLTNDHLGALANATISSDVSELRVGLHAYTFDRTNFQYITPQIRTITDRDFTDKDEISLNARYSHDIDQLRVYGSAELRSLGMETVSDQTIGGDIDIDESYTFLNTVVGVDYALSGQGSLYLSYGIANREPTRSDILNGVTKAERVHDLELGYRYAAGALALDANVFYMNFDNEIAKIGALQDQSYIELRQNMDNSVRSGLEVIASYEATESVNLSLTGSYTSSNIDNYTNDGQTFSDVEHVLVPRWVLQPSISVGLGESASLRVDSRYVSDMYSELSNADAFVVPSHFVTDVQLSVTPIDRLTLTLSANNIFDQLYYTEGSPIDTDWDGISEQMGFRVQPPRHFYVMASFDF